MGTEAGKKTQPSHAGDKRRAEKPVLRSGSLMRRLRAAHRNWFRPILVGVIVTVLGGLALAGVVVLIHRHEHKTPESAVAARVVSSVESFEARDATKGRPFPADKVPIDPGDRIVFRVGLHNASGRDLTKVVIWPGFGISDLFNVTLGLSAFDGVQDDYNSTVSQLAFDPAREVGMATLDPRSLRLLDEHLQLIRRIAPDVDRNGGSSDQIAVGPLARNATVYVEFAATVGRDRSDATAMLASGPLIAVRDASSKHYRSDYFVAKPGETLVVSVEMHNAGRSPVLAPTLRVDVSRSRGFARVTAHITHAPDPQSGANAQSYPYTINYVGDQNLTVQYVPGSTYALRCPRVRCTPDQYVKTQLPDGIVQGGIEPTPALGVGAKALMFVDFRLHVVRR
jgi:hypothetical protein